MVRRAPVVARDSVPETLGDWLEKWEPRIPNLRKKRQKKERKARADNALDELEFLLARTVENQVSE